MRYFAHKNTGSLYILVDDLWREFKPDGAPAGRWVQHMYVRRWWPTTEVFVTPVSHWMLDYKLVEISRGQASRLDAEMVGEVQERVDEMDALLSSLMGDIRKIS